MNHITQKILSIALFILLMACTAAGDKAEIDPDADVNVTVNAPKHVSEDTFEVTLDVTEIIDFDSGQFDLIYDPDVVKVLKVEAGDIDDTEIPIDMKRHFEEEDPNRYKVLVNIPGVDGVSGSGYLAKITFEVVGGTGDTSAIDVITDPDEEDKVPNLCYTEEDVEHPGHHDPCEITANWFGTTVTIGTAPPESDETPTPTPTETPAVNVTLDALESVSAPTPTEAPVTESLELSSNPSGLPARAESAPAAAVPGASSEPSEDGGFPDIPTAGDIVPIYSLVGLLALIYTLTQFR